MRNDDAELSRAMERARHLRIAYEHVREDPNADSTHLAALRDEIAAADADVAELKDRAKGPG